LLDDAALSLSSAVFAGVSALHRDYFDWCRHNAMDYPVHRRGLPSGSTRKPYSYP
jgi:hypothetical protein